MSLKIVSVHNKFANHYQKTAPLYTALVSLSIRSNRLHFAIFLLLQISLFIFGFSQFSFIGFCVDPSVKCRFRLVLPVHHANFVKSAKSRYGFVWVFAEIGRKLLRCQESRCRFLFSDFFQRDSVFIFPPSRSPEYPSTTLAVMFAESSVWSLVKTKTPHDVIFLYLSVERVHWLHLR